MYKKAIQHFKKNDNTIYKLSTFEIPFEITLHPDPFQRLVRSIVGQQLSVKAAQTIYLRFENLFEGKVINAEILSKLKDEELKIVGLSRQKILYLKDLSQRVLNNEVDFEKFSVLSDKEIIEELIKIKGVGQWTAEMFLMFSLARPDVFSFGDLGLQNAIKRAYLLSQKPTIEYMEKLSVIWKPYRTYAAMILWKSLQNEPK